MPLIIHTVITRDSPNLECGFFAALLSNPDIREAFGIKKNFRWEFVPTSTVARDQEGVLYFNVGGGVGFDQHGRSEDNTLCSLEIARKKGFDFLVGRDWMRSAFELICENDKHGKRISTHPDNLRELVARGLSIHFEKNPLELLHWMEKAFLGVFANLRKNVALKDVFSPKQLVQGVELVDRNWAASFRALLETAKQVKQEDWEGSVRAVDDSIREGRYREVYVPALGRTIHVIFVPSHYHSIGPAARQKYRGCTVIQATGSRFDTGTLQIYGGGFREDDGTINYADMGPVVAELRKREAATAGRTLYGDESTWDATGFVGGDKKLYLTEFRTTILNGSTSAPNVPSTSLDIRNDIFPVVCEFLPKGDRWTQSKEGKRVRVPLSELT